MSLPGAILFLVRVLPGELGIALAQLSVLTYLLLRPDYRKETLQNYWLVRGEKDSRFWLRNCLTVGRNLALMARMGSARGDEIVDNAEVYIDNITLQTLERELHSIMVSFHFGLWEFLPRVFTRAGYRVRVVTGRQKDKLLERLIRRIRKDRQSPKVGPVRITGFMLDNTCRGVQEWVELAGLKLRFPRAPFRLAARNNSKAIPLFAWLERGRLHVEVGRPGTEVDAARMLLRLVRNHPEEWLFWAKASALQPAEESE
ncbi:MAG: hypothetical protein ABIK44_05230 [candidate division WOR-3 bacterium]